MLTTKSLIAGFLLAGVLALPSAAQILWGTDGTAICDSPAVQETPSVVSDGLGGAIVVWANRVPGTSYNIFAQRVDSSGHRRWGADSFGIPICSAAYDQYTPVIAPDGFGGAVIAWQDARAATGESDIYAQRVNTAGTALWTTNGVSVSAAPQDQYSPCIVSDGQGGAFIAFRDTRNDAETGSSDIYMQHIGANGVPLLPADLPIATSTLQDDQDAVMIPDGAGGVIIGWSDGRGFGAAPSTGQDIYAQRVGADGSLLWGSGGVPVCTAINYQRFPDIVPDGSGGVIICWDDRRNGVDYNVYAQQLNASGARQWSANGVAVCSATGNQVVPTMQADSSGGAIVSWTDARAGSTLSTYDIFAQRLSASGGTVWQTNGVAVCTAAGWQGRIKSAVDPSGGVFLAWSDNRVDPTNMTYNYDVYTQQLNTSGTPLWSANGAAACSASSKQEPPKVTDDGLGRCLIV